MWVRKRISFKIRNCKGIVLFLQVALLCSACGYRVRSAVGRLPSSVQSLGIPTFQNLTNQYRVEQVISRAVLREFSLRTRVSVNSSESGVDSVLLGEIRSVNSVPVTFGTTAVGAQTFGSAYLVTIQLSVKLIRLNDSATIWQAEDFVFRDRYALNTNVQDFFSEENPTLERMARDFASSLVSTILDRSKP